MFQDTRARRSFAALAACVMLAAPAGAADDPDRIAVLRVEDLAYQALERSDAADETPATGTRLVVVRDGRVAADHALRRTEQLATRRDEDGQLIRREDAWIDDAWVTPDGSAAIVAHRRYVVERPLDARERPDPDRFDIVEAGLTVEWVDLDHPYGRWSEVVAEGLVLDSVRLMDSGAAVAIMVTDGERSELHVYGADGGLRAMQRDLISTNPEIREATDGSTIVIDIGYASRPGLPDRALLVVGLDRDASWTYTWSYGSDQEPVSWQVSSDGVLQVTTAAFVFRYAADGTPIASERRR